jgi:nitrite reductase (NADH) large subunit
VTERRADVVSGVSREGRAGRGANEEASATNVADPGSATMPRLVVVGHGPTSYRLVEALVAKGFHGLITVLREEPRAAYDRVALTSYLAGKSAEDLTYPVPSRPRRGRAAALLQGHRDRQEGPDGRHRRRPCRAVRRTGAGDRVQPVRAAGPGQGRGGLFVYRTIDDLDAIREASGRATNGVVIGGGLLGLEAADAMRGLGLSTHIVEMGGWLMPRQVDEGGGAVLRNHIEALGLSVHTEAGVKEIVAGPDGRVMGLLKPDRQTIEAQVVVFSAGIRPRDELARQAGLEVGGRGGIAVDDGMRTSDPAIYAVGECALHEGMVYGLVGPCFTMAEVAADRIFGGEAVFTGADLSTKLKLLGVEVAQFGANIQRNGTYSVVPRIPGGEITPDKLIVIGEVARDFDLYTKITGGQRSERGVPRSERGVVNDR